ncbi:uncharacterized protein LOC127095414 [Lathyrus oleraceus]|uniref:uncharacterized protein LOC127095414 n=1 Tax=Pisum sativum TaxID=3888 RepID=UPI0021D2A69C|nr:uncharacterized protein LOC127095414 [Pisum sativum]
MIVVDYAVKFEELSMLFMHYNGVGAEGSNCIKFESGFHPEIMKFIRIYNKDSCARSAHLRVLVRRGVGIKTMEELIELQLIKGSVRLLVRKTNEGGTPTSVKCFSCGGMGHCASECKSYGKKCFKCGKIGQRIADYKINLLTCFNYGEACHISTHFQKSKKSQSRGKVFALSGTETTRYDNLIRGMYFINGLSLIAMIDMGVTCYFISLILPKRLNLEISSMVRSMVIDTPTNGLMTTSWFFFNFPLTIYGKDFGIELVCLWLSQLEVILGMNWSEFNHVYINYLDKSVMFPEFKVGGYMMFMSAKKVDKALKYDACVFMMFSSLKDENKVVVGDLSIVSDFSEVFPDDISGLPPKREVEFAIDLVPGTSLVPMTPYRISALEQRDSKKHLEDLLQKKFV